MLGGHRRRCFRWPPVGHISKRAPQLQRLGAVEEEILPTAAGAPARAAMRAARSFLAIKLSPCQMLISAADFYMNFVLAVPDMPRQAGIIYACRSRLFTRAISVSSRIHGDASADCAHHHHHARRYAMHRCFRHHRRRIFPWLSQHYITSSDALAGPRRRLSPADAAESDVGFSSIQRALKSYRLAAAFSPATQMSMTLVSEDA